MNTNPDSANRLCESSIMIKSAKVYFCRPQKLIQTYPPVFGKFSRDFYSKNCPDGNI